MSTDPDRVRSILDSQRTYYDERANDYADPSKPSDRKMRGFVPEQLAMTLVDEFEPVGDVLELACGTGIFTRELARHAHSVTAVDGSPRMLAINKERLADPKVTYVHADLFRWEPDQTYDAVFFGFWLSHVPPTAFDDFWELVKAALRPSGRVAFIDEDERAEAYEHSRPVDEIPSALRTLSDGRQFEIVKVFWRPSDLQNRLASSGWDIDVRRVGEAFLYGVGKQCGPGSDPARA